MSRIWLSNTGETNMALISNEDKQTAGIAALGVLGLAKKAARLDLTGASVADLVDIQNLVSGTSAILADAVEYLDAVSENINTTILRSLDLPDAPPNPDGDLQP
jgi:hypothetical protein